MPAVIHPPIHQPQIHQNFFRKPTEDSPVPATLKSIDGQTEDLPVEKESSGNVKIYKKKDKKFKENLEMSEGVIFIE
ncbi:MAG TPA: hypothetical protein VIO11_11290 [Candidatus Methanoperedens sp.]